MRSSPAFTRARRIAGVERFRQEVVGADLEAPDHALRVLEARDHDHGQVPEGLVALHPLEHLEPVDPRHLDVEQDHVGRVLADRGERLGAVGRRGRAVTVALERRGEEPSIQRVVVDDEDVPGSTLHPSPSCLSAGRDAA